ncbi:MAG: sigma-70 family RNA polymerase sigma factor, partial [Clostridia bacterium]|nr:sigma-70 family RNA polymerase sigma factor [Clostridia bacterium]
MLNENLVSYVLDAQQGNEDAFAKLYSRTLKNAYYLCLKLTADNAQAEDVLKKGYAAAFCSLGRLKRPEAFESWLKQKMAAVYKSTQNFGFADADGDAVPTASEFLPASVLDDDSLCRRIEDYVAYLPAEQRTVAVLYYCVGMPVDFIAKFLNVSASTVDSLLSKAREGIVEPLNLGPVTLSEDTLPVLTKIFQRSSADVKIDNDLVRQAFIYAIDRYHNNENPLDEVTVYPDAQPAANDVPETDEPAEPEEPQTEEPAEPEEPETQIIEEGVKPSAAVTGDDLLKEINQSITEIAGSPLLKEEEEDPIGEGIYISQIPDDEPAQEDIPVAEKKTGNQEKNKTKLFIAIAAILLALVVAAVIGIAKRGKSGGNEQTTVPADSTVAAETVK